MKAIEPEDRDPKERYGHHNIRNAYVVSAGATRPFDFVETVNRAPMFLRRAALKELGGIDLAFAPFQCDDVDICLKA